jgi:tetratricopeptide (TPR) repeat protein
MTRLFALVAALIAPVISVGQGSLPPNTSGHFTVETKSTAAAQLAYANRLQHELLTIPLHTIQRMQATAQAAAALDVVASRWPRDVAAVGQACVQKALLFLNEKLFRNSEQTCESGAEKIAGSAAEAELMTVKGTAFSREGNYGEATKTFRAAERHGKFADLAPGLQFSLYNESAFVCELTGKPGEAARFLRKAAAVDGVHLITKAGALLGVIEMSERESDHGSARAALREFDEVITAASRTSLPPADIEGLHSLETASKRWHKKLGD